jgi:hypothetical protein
LLEIALQIHEVGETGSLFSEPPQYALDLVVFSGSFGSHSAVKAETTAWEGRREVPRGKTEAHQETGSTRP